LIEVGVPEGVSMTCITLINFDWHVNKYKKHFVLLF